MSKTSHPPFEFSTQPLSLPTTIGEGFKLFSYTIGKTWQWSFLFHAIGTLPSFIRLLFGSAPTQKVLTFTMMEIFTFGFVFLFTISVHVFSLVFLTHRIYNLAVSPDSKAIESIKKTQEKWLTTFLASVLFVIAVGIAMSILIMALIQSSILLGFISLGILTFVSILLVFYWPLILFDNESVLDSLKKSYLLVNQHWWETFLVLLPAVIITMILMMFATSIQAPNSIGLILSMMVISSVTALLTYSFVLVQFNNLKLLKNQKGLSLK